MRLVVAAVFALLPLAACGPRRTLEPYERMVFAPIEISPSVLPFVASPTALVRDLERAYVHYLEWGGQFREVAIATGTAIPDDRTVVVQPVIRSYTADAGRGAGKVVGGRARGNAVVRYSFRSRRAGLITVEDMRSFALSGIGAFVDVPVPAGVDPTAEGIAAQLHWWLRRNKPGPLAAEARAVDDEEGNR